jgi:hypothetical protein
MPWDGLDGARAAVERCLLSWMQMKQRMPALACGYPKTLSKGHSFMLAPSRPLALMSVGRGAQRE